MANMLELTIGGTREVYDVQFGDAHAGASKADKMKQKKPLDRQIFNGGQPFEKGDGKLFRQFQECTQFNGTRYYGESACFCSRPVSAKTAC